VGDEYAISQEYLPVNYTIWIFWSLFVAGNFYGYHILAPLLAVGTKWFMTFRVYKFAGQAYGSVHSSAFNREESTSNII
jgi:hypothetical protein